MTEIEISEELIERIARRVIELLRDDPFVRRRILFSEHETRLSEVFPTYPKEVAIENSFEAQDALRSRQVHWYSMQGFSSKAAGAIVANHVDPLRLLAMQKGETVSLRNIGPVFWTEIEQWQQRNHSLSPHEG